MKSKWGSLLTGLLLFFSGCDCDDEKTCADSEIVAITTTIKCGWSQTSNDSLTIMGNRMTYHHNCGGQNPIEKNLSCRQWSGLTESIDVAKFNSLNRYSCSVCVDGCDFSISIQTHSGYHRIVFPYYSVDDSQIPEEIRDLYAQIDRIRKNVREKVCQSE